MTSIHFLCCFAQMRGITQSLSNWHLAKEVLCAKNPFHLFPLHEKRLQHFPEFSWTPNIHKHGTEDPGWDLSPAGWTKSKENSPRWEELEEELLSVGFSSWGFYRNLSFQNLKGNYRKDGEGMFMRAWSARKSWDIGKEFLAGRVGRPLDPGSAQSQVGHWGLEQPGTLQGIPAHGKG